MKLKTKIKVKQQAGLYFKDGDLIMSNKFPNNAKVLKEVYIAAIEYVRQLIEHKRSK